MTVLKEEQKSHQEIKPKLVQTKNYQEKLPYIETDLPKPDISITSYRCACPYGDGHDKLEGRQCVINIEHNMKDREISVGMGRENKRLDLIRYK